MPPPPTPVPPFKNGSSPSYGSSPSSFPSPCPKGSVAQREAHAACRLPRCPPCLFTLKPNDGVRSREVVLLLPPPPGQPGQELAPCSVPVISGAARGDFAAPFGAGDCDSLFRGLFCAVPAGQSWGGSWGFPAHPLWPCHACASSCAANPPLGNPAEPLRKGLCAKVASALRNPLRLRGEEPGSSLPPDPTFLFLPVRRLSQPLGAEVGEALGGPSPWDTKGSRAVPEERVREELCPLCPGLLDLSSLPGPVGVPPAAPSPRDAPRVPLQAV